jgi:hypothetical protein
MAELDWRDIRQGTTSPVEDDPALLQTYDAGAFRINADPATMAAGLLGWFCTIGGHPGTWIELYAGVSSTPASPGSFWVAVIDQDALIANGVTSGFGLASDTTGRWGVVQSTGVPATDMAAALVAAKLRPFRTAQRAGQMLPRFGNDGTFKAMLLPRTSGATYLKMDGVTPETFSDFDNVTGWKRGLIAGTTDFSNSAADKITLGFRTVSGTNAGGYNPTGGATVSSIPCQLAGGGAASLPAETDGLSTIGFKRIRFSATTTTAALRNKCGSIWKNTASLITPGDDVAATPATGDVFYIEEPGVAVGSLSMTAGATSLTFVGIRFTASALLTGRGTVVRFAACDVTGGTLSASNLVQFSAGPFYFDEIGNVIEVGLSFRASQALIITNALSANMASFGVMGNSAINRIKNVGSIEIGVGSHARAGIYLNGCGGAPIAANLVVITRIGNAGSTTSRRLRASSNPTNNPTFSFEACPGGVLYGADASGNNQGAPSCVVGISSSGGAFVVDDLVSTDGGNDGVVLDLSGARDSTVYVGLTTPVTAAATQGDVKMAGGALQTFAALAVCNMIDTAGNDVVGTGGRVV